MAAGRWRPATYGGGAGWGSGATPSVTGATEYAAATPAAATAADGDVPVGNTAVTGATDAPPGAVTAAADSARAPAAVVPAAELGLAAGGRGAAAASYANLPSVYGFPTHGRVVNRGRKRRRRVPTAAVQIGRAHV